MPSVMEKEELVIRALRLEDYQNGFLECLSNLTTVGSITEAQFKGIIDSIRQFVHQRPAERFELFQKSPETYKLMVITKGDDPRVLGAGTLVIEPKFIHGCGSVQRHCMIKIIICIDRSCGGHCGSSRFSWARSWQKVRGSWEVSAQLFVG